MASFLSPHTQPRILYVGSHTGLSQAINRRKSHGPEPGQQWREVRGEIHVRAMPEKEVQDPCSDMADEKEAGVQNGALVIKGG